MTEAEGDGGRPDEGAAQPQDRDETGRAPAGGPPGGAPAAPCRTRIRLRWLRPGGEVSLLIALALGVRVLAWFLRPAVLRDSVDLMDSADRFARDGWGALLHIHHHPLPVVLLAWLPDGADRETWGSLGAALLSALAVAPLHAIARCAGGRHAATLAGLLYAVLPKFVSISSVPLAEGVFLPLFAAAFATALAAAVGRTPRRRLARAGLAGAFAGLAYLARPEGLVAGAAVALAAALRSRRGERIRTGLATVLVFAVVAAPYAWALSSAQGHLALSTKKDLSEFAGLAGAHPGRWGGDVSLADGIRGLADAVWGAAAPVLAFVLIGAFPRKRWQRGRSGSARTVLLGTTVVLFALLVRLQTGWGYAAGRQTAAGVLLLLPFAGEGMVVVVGFLTRTFRRRRAALVLAMMVTIPMGVVGVLRPDGESGVLARALGEHIARIETDRGGSGDVTVASFDAPLVAYYADRALRGAAPADVPPRRVRNLRLPRRDFGNLLTKDSDLPSRRADLAAALRAGGASWLVIRYFQSAESATGTVRMPGEELAAALLADGTIAAPAVGSGELAAFPVPGR